VKVNPRESNRVSREKSLKIRIHKLAPQNGAKELFSPFILQGWNLNLNLEGGQPNEIRLDAIILCCHPTKRC